MDSKGDVRQFFWLVFRKPLARTLARILLLFEAFASGFPRPDFEMISERVQTSVYLAIVFFSMVFLLVYTCFLRCRRARDLGSQHRGTKKNTVSNQLGIFEVGRITLPVLEVWWNQLHLTLQSLGHCMCHPGIGQKIWGRRHGR